MQKILLFGRNGQLGHALQRVLAARGELVAHDRAGCDLANMDAVREAVRAARPQIIVNAAAYTAVDKAESEPELCRRINADAPRVMAEEAARCGARLVHYSTDYVFDGAKDGYYDEDDATGPVNVYGETKLAGDRAIAASGAKALILRVSWVYGPTGHNFARTMLRLAAERDALRVVSDQIGAPTSVERIAEVTGRWLDRWREGADDGTGVYHLAAAGETSWHGFATALIEEALRLNWPLRANPQSVAAISTAEYPTAARRPRNSRLATKKIRAVLSMPLPDWREDATRLVRQLDVGRA